MAWDRIGQRIGHQETACDAKNKLDVVSDELSPIRKQSQKSIISQLGAHQSALVPCSWFYSCRARNFSRETSRAEGPATLPKTETKAKGEATHSIAVAGCCNFISLFSAQKSHIKPQSRLTPTNKIRSSLQISYLQSAILNIEIRNKQAPETRG
jgi:hypothetical protein